MKVTKVGVGVVVVRDNRVLLGRRKSKLGNNEWGFPGGTLNYLEKAEDCADRELVEETSMSAAWYEKVYFDSAYYPLIDEHYVTLFVQAVNVTGEPVVCEPDKCYEWGWFDWFDPPIHVFAPTEALMRSGFIPEGITRTA